MFSGGIDKQHRARWLTKIFSLFLLAPFNPFLANVPELYPLKTFSLLVFSRAIKWKHWPGIG